MHIIIIMLFHVVFVVQEARKDDVPSRKEELKDGPSPATKRTSSDAQMDESNYYEIKINKSIR